MYVSQSVGEREGGGVMRTLILVGVVTNVLKMRSGSVPVVIQTG